MRDDVLREQPFCPVCGELTTECDHLDGKAATEHDFRRDNLIGLCASCHSEKTGQQQAGKPWRPKGCDALGNPIAEQPGPWNRT